MATKENLMGLGVPHFAAGVLGRTPSNVTCAGTTMASARVCGGTDYDLYIIASNSGNGVVLKSPASTDGYMIGDEIWVANGLGASVALYIRNGTSVLVNGTSVSGSLGVSIGAAQQCIAKVISASTWSIIGSVLSN